MGLIGLAWEWPLRPLAGSLLHRRIEIRLVVYPMSALFAALLYQGTDPALYYLIGIGVYFWAYSEGEVCYMNHPCAPGNLCLLRMQIVCPEPWTLPKRSRVLKA